jgi:hypothetical protein
MRLGTGGALGMQVEGEITADGTDESPSVRNWVSKDSKHLYTERRISRGSVSTIITPLHSSKRLATHRSMEGFMSSNFHARRPKLQQAANQRAGDGGRAGVGGEIRLTQHANAPLPCFGPCKGSDNSSSHRIVALLLSAVADRMTVSPSLICVHLHVTDLRDSRPWLMCATLLSYSACA